MRKKHLFDKIIHFSMQFSAVLNIFIVKTKLYSTFTNDLKRKENFPKNDHSYRVCSFKSVCNKEHKGVMCNTTSSSSSFQSTRPVGRVLWEELLVLSRFHS